VLVHWNPAKFEHTKTGFALDGKHTGLACAKCHSPARISSTERATIQLKDVNHTYLGLTKTCGSCHEDKHKGQLGANCLQCHNSTDWKDAKDFDHSRSKFALTGAHRQVSCKQCHVTGSDGTPMYVGLKFERCASCHNDPHRGEFRQGCESCHSTPTWKRTAFATEFDHSKTKYPLIGRHLDVACLACHRGGDFKTPMAHNDCRDCHKPDPHNGQFVARADGGRCDSCHSLEGFKPARYTVADHKMTRFELQGKHLELQCAKCHTPAGRATLFKIQSVNCVSCHQDVHKGQFSRAPYFNNCEQCHNQTTFHAAGFDLARHQKTRFALTGGHLAVACNECHKGTSGQTNSPMFHFDQLSCTSCHADPHKGQFATRMQAMDSARPLQGCEACHSTKSWKDLTRFDHGTTKFVLTGAHRAVDCVGCHRPPNLEHRLINVDFRLAPIECEECHENIHGKQFSKTDNVTRCAGCHNSTKWRPSLIDHDKTAFPLKGAHENVRCAACHKGVREMDGKQVLVYGSTPRQCAACHGIPVVNKNDVTDAGNRRQVKR
jgi:hypothetical protein